MAVLKVVVAVAVVVVVVVAAVEEVAAVVVLRISRIPQIRLISSPLDEWIEQN